MRFGKDSHGGDLCAKYDFSVNISPLGMSEKVREACLCALDRSDRYPDPHCTRLREALAEKEGVRAENVLAGNGAAELIYAYAAVHAGEGAAVLAPTFSEYGNAVAAYGGQVRYLLGLHSVTESALRGVRTLFVCAPNNPDGYLFTRTEIFKLREMCQRTGVELFVDGCFFDFTQSPGYTLSELLEGGGVYVLQAFTKSYALAGVRLGYLLGEAEKLAEISKKMQPWNVSAVAQAAGIAAAKDSQYLIRLRETVAKEREFLKSGLCAAGYQPRSSSANFLLFEGEEDLSARLRECGVAIRVCEDFVGLTAENGKKFYRIGVRTHEENQEFLSALARIVRRP